MPTVPSQFRFTAAELDLMDRLGERFKNEPEVKVSRATVLRIALNRLAAAEGLLPKSNVKKKSRRGA